MSKEISTWADSAMFRAEEVDTSGPKVYLLEMTSDPLGSIAALSAMYTGKVIRSKKDVTDEERDHHLREMQLTHLKTPLEAVKLHFMIEGVTRAFTHQLVRNRTSAFAQESMRFAVKEDMPVALPPSLAGTMSEKEWRAAMAEDYGDDADLAPAFDRESDKQKMRIEWGETVEHIKRSYNKLVDMGMPAEDARGIAPTNVLTRINYVTDLRTLLGVLDVRLCTQAQFEWRQVANLIAQSIADNYHEDKRHIRLWHEYQEAEDIEETRLGLDRIRAEYRTIAGLFRPICYRTGKCEFRSDADRECSIRSRVDANAAINRPSSEWHQPLTEWDSERPGVLPNKQVVTIERIRPEEWMLDPGAAR